MGMQVQRVVGRCMQTLRLYGVVYTTPHGRCGVYAAHGNTLHTWYTLTLHIAYLMVLVVWLLADAAIAGPRQLAAWVMCPGRGCWLAAGTVRGGARAVRRMCPALDQKFSEKFCQLRPSAIVNRPLLHLHLPTRLHTRRPFRHLFRTQEVSRG